MSLTVGNQYLASEFIALKARVKAEMQRRQYEGPLTIYGSANYDYSTTPESDDLVLVEHLNKLVEPLNAINTTGISKAQAGDTIHAINALNTFLSNAENYEVDSATTDCKTSCSGLCLSGCGGSCTGCSGTCVGDCKGGCSGGCGGDCKTGCWGCKGCSGGCSGCAGCGSACSKNCSAACRSSARTGQQS